MLSAYALDSFLYALCSQEPPFDSLKHSKNGVFCPNAHQHLEQLVVLEEVETLELDSFLLQKDGNGFRDGVKVLYVVVE